MLRTYTTSVISRSISPPAAPSALQTTRNPPATESKEKIFSGRPAASESVKDSSHKRWLVLRPELPAGASARARRFFGTSVTTSVFGVKKRIRIAAPATCSFLDGM